MSKINILQPNRFEQAKLYFRETLCTVEELAKLFHPGKANAFAATEQVIDEMKKGQRLIVNQESEIEGIDTSWNPEKAIEHIRLPKDYVNNLNFK